MRLLVPHAREVGVDDLAELYAVPEGRPWLRMNFIATIDGGAWGADGLSGSINNPIDKVVFHLLRDTSDAVIVGSGTAIAEGYGPARVPLVLVSRQGRLPEKVGTNVVLVTVAKAAGLETARERLGADGVLVLGEDEVDLAGLRPALAERGWTNLLCEGGPALFGSMLHAGIVDELCLTQAPVLTSGTAGRIAAGPDVTRAAALELLLEDDGTIFSRWRLER